MDGTLVITSRQNPRVKKLAALSDKKTREAEGLFRFDGIKLFEEAAACGVEIESVYIKESLSGEICARLSHCLEAIPRERIACLSDSVFDRVTEEKSPEGIITVAKYIDKFRKIVKIDKEDFPRNSESVLILESVRDPGNVGTIIRSAAALGVGRVLFTSDCADLYNPKTIRAAMGALFRINADKIDAPLLPEYILGMRGTGRRVFAASLDEGAVLLGDTEISSGDCFVIGNEGHGLSEQTIKACNGSVIIPMQAGCESLNAAAASVIFIWEMKKAYDKTK
ncbi:MAG: RNA methyltransferase [Clostridia bacterium]|nr:RNA methyltransferase [Clostridia bacterium]